MGAEDAWGARTQPTAQPTAQPSTNASLPYTTAQCLPGAKAVHQTDSPCYRQSESGDSVQPGPGQGGAQYLLCVVCP